MYTCFLHCRSVFLCVLLLVAVDIGAEKVLVYDEEKGIIFVEKDQAGTQMKPSKKKKKSEQRQTHRGAKPAPEPPSKKKDIHIGREKDPPDLYFRSGLEYFKNKDYENALKNFTFADSADPKPLYSLWVGKSLRQLGRDQQMLFVMDKIINTFPESDVADDALFEKAFYHQKIGDYENAMRLYAQLSEQYPFGQSFSNGQEFREIAREQRRIMRAEIISILRLLGYTGEDISDLYRSFQKAEGLEVTGGGNLETIKAIRSRHEDLLQKEEEKRAMEKRVNRHRKWGLFLGAFAFVNMVVIVVQRMIIHAKTKHLESLTHELSDLDTQAI
ncbi:MAG: tetratricopeptide repeat protein [Chitinivibrionales bacterium]|nr:tetratricopeptide repeat protein [Chitinivibrionales bacterium]